VKRISASATSLGVGVVYRETLLLDGVLEVDGGAVKVRNAHFVDSNLYSPETYDRIALEYALVEIELVDQATATTWLNSDPQTKIVATFL
jgi:hypothetical protein